MLSYLSKVRTGCMISKRRDHCQPTIHSSVIHLVVSYEYVDFDVFWWQSFTEAWFVVSRTNESPTQRCLFLWLGQRSLARFCKTERYVLVDDGSSQQWFECTVSIAAANEMKCQALHHLLCHVSTAVWIVVTLSVRRQESWDTKRSLIKVNKTLPSTALSIFYAW